MHELCPPASVGAGESGDGSRRSRGGRVVEAGRCSGGVTSQPAASALPLAARCRSLLAAQPLPASPLARKRTTPVATVRRLALEPGLPGPGVPFEASSTVSWPATAAASSSLAPLPFCSPLSPAAFHFAPRSVDARSKVCDRENL